ncbi:methyl-accepting chemotaxis protein [Archangium violaceum]|uniref:methyl-accepting chemotaxis protein n=1 Tax=Archangium violaceum TaxID=83451 RepID=UPI00194FCABE|nr:methyl-accepting chemotaxis protein [Archangium violaceum]QRN96374.1 methyl-accepting chemotaxis protein [Archangium violaceum]
MGEGEVNVESLVRRRRAVNLISTLLGLGPTVFLLGLMLGLTGEQMWKLLGMHVLVALGLYRLVLAMPLQVRLMRLALEPRPGEPPGPRLARILELPQQLHLLHLGLITVMQVAACFVYCWYFERPMLLALPCAAVQVVLMAFVLVHHLQGVEDTLLPQAVEEFHRAPSVRPAPRPLLWRRLRWFLPYISGLTLACALAVPGGILWSKGRGALGQLELELTLAVMGLFFGGVGILSTWRIARQIDRGARRLQLSLEQAATGDYQPPAWISTDELGRLAIVTTRALLGLNELARRLRESGQQLQLSAEELGRSQEEQREKLEGQVTALENTRAHAQGLLKTSELSVHKAEAVIGLAEKASASRQSGLAAVHQGIASLAVLQDESGQLLARLRSLEESTGQLEDLTGRVQGLLIQSRQLALNASIESAGSGILARDFSNVALQSRLLAERSLAATRQVHVDLQDMRGALREAVRTTQQGAASVARDMRQVREAGEALGMIATSAEESAEAARTIAGVLGEQNEGIARLSQAVSGLLEVAGRVSHQARDSSEVTLEVRELAGKVIASVREQGAAVDAGPVPGGEAERSLLVRGLVRVQLFTLLLWVGPSTWLMWLLLGLEPKYATEAAVTGLIPLLLVCGALLPVRMARRLTNWALESPPGSSPESRLRRMLELPRRQGVSQILVLAAASLVGAWVCCVLYGGETWRALPCALMSLLVAAFASVPEMLRMEDAVRPLAARRFLGNPEVELPGSWPFWRSLDWYLPYLMGLSAICALSTMAVVLGCSRSEAALRLTALAVESKWELAVMGTLLVLQAGRIARRMALQLARGTLELETSLVSIADMAGSADTASLAGREPPLPRWVSTDEIGILSLATAPIFKELGRLTREVVEDNARLEQASEKLGSSRSRQAEGFARQAEAVAEADATMREVKRTSSMAAFQAAAVLERAERSETFRRVGEAAIAEGQRGLVALQQHQREMEGRLDALAKHAGRVSAATALLRQLASECDVLALNASIQAMQAGDAGRVFSVIARELRGLAESSSQTTREAEPLLKGITRETRALAEAVRERGGRLGEGLAQAHRLSEELRQLSALVEEYRGAARQIAAAIHQQNAAIDEVLREMTEVDRAREALTRGLAASPHLRDSVGRRLVPSAPAGYLPLA